MLEGFEILGLLGEGGMGVVHKARHLASGRNVALKRMKGSADPAAIARFRREVAALASIAHPSSVRAVAHGEGADGLPWLAMELVPGESLAELLAREGPLAPTRVADLWADVLSALEVVHGAGLVHRDLKPGNVLLRRGFIEGRGVGERAVICDYGLARLAGDDGVDAGRTREQDGGVAESPADIARLTQTGALVGTPVYMSPEQLLGDALDARTDLYSSAVMAYELLSGRPPFRGESLPALIAQILEGRPAPLPPVVSPAFSALIFASLSRDRDARPASARELRERLARCRPTPLETRARALDAKARMEVSLPALSMPSGLSERLRPLRAFAGESPWSTLGRAIFVAGALGVALVKAADHVERSAKLERAREEQRTREAEIRRTPQPRQRTGP